MNWFLSSVEHNMIFLNGKNFVGGNFWVSDENFFPTGEIFCPIKKPFPDDEVFPLRYSKHNKIRL